MPQTHNMRILYPKSVSKTEADAAQQGITKHFSRFHVVCDSAQVGASYWNSKQARSVYIGEKLANLVNRDAPATSICDLSGDTVMGVLRFRQKQSFGLGITNQPLTLIRGFGIRDHTVVGIACCSGGGIMSLSGLGELPEEERYRAIENAAAHVAGRVFGQRQVCGKSDCIMGQSRTVDLVQRFVRETREFCNECAGMIQTYLGPVERRIAGL